MNGLHVRIVTLSDVYGGFRWLWISCLTYTITLFKWKLEIKIILQEMINREKKSRNVNL
jgi:hypothetical protein